MRVAFAAAAVALIVGIGLGAQESESVDMVVQKIADALKKGDKDTANKLAAAYRKQAESVEDVMDLFKFRPIKFRPRRPFDGIEVKIREAARDGDKDFVKNAPKWEELAFKTAALAWLPSTSPRK